MMKSLLTLALVALPGLALAPAATAAEPGPPGAREPGVLFQRLDQNQDGRITKDEIPDRAPGFMGEMLKRADKNQDQAVTREELLETLAQFRPGPGGGPGREERAERPSREPRGAGPPEATDRGQRGPAAGPPAAGQRGERGPAGPPQRGRGPRPESGQPAAGPGALGDPQALFRRLDRDGNGSLNPEEFATGMRRFHEAQGGGRPASGPGAPGGPRGDQRRQQPPWAAGGPWAGSLGPWHDPAWGGRSSLARPGQARPGMQGPHMGWQGRAGWMQGPRRGPSFGPAPWMQGPWRGPQQFGPRAPWDRGAGAGDAEHRRDEGPDRRERADRRPEAKPRHEARGPELKKDRPPQAKKPAPKEDRPKAPRA